MSTPIQDLAAAMADRTDVELLDLLVFLGPGHTTEERLIEFAIAEVVEARHPELVQILDDWSTDLDLEQSMTDVVAQFLRGKEAQS